MKPDFALKLSFDGISLLQKVRGGWAVLGTAGLDGDLAAEMADLRKTALAESADGTIVKLLLPEEQIKFLSRDASGDKTEAARAALEGATPYEVSELRIDAEEAGGQLHVAAVAEETIEEAEAFALEHGFVPVGFVAAKSNGFNREVLFGEAASWTGAALKPDTGGLRIVPKPAPEPEPEPVAPASATQDAPPEPPAAPTALDPLAVEPTAKAEDEPAETEDAPQATGDQEPPAAPPYPVRERPADPLAAPRAPDPTPPAAPVAFQSIRARRDVPETPRAPLRADATPSRLSLSAEPQEPAPRKTPPPEAPARPAPALEESLKRPEPAPPRKPAPAAKAEPAPPAPNVAAPAAAAAPAPKLSARERIAELRPGAADAGTALDTPALAAAAVPVDEEPRQTPRNAETSREGGMKLFGLGRKKPKQDTSAQNEELKRMTVFGARRDEIVIGGKPRFLGLMLTSALILFLLGVAAWASVFLEDGLARFFSSDPEPEVAALPEDAVDTLPEVTGLRPTARPEEAAPVVEARLETETDAAPEIAEPRSVPAAPEAMTPDEAEATYAATGIWQRAPNAPSEIEETGSGDPYVASIDPVVAKLDATALPEADASTDTALEPLPLPAPAGTPFDLDTRGLVRATPEGAVNPDRVRVFAGLPPAVPPLRGDALAPVIEAIPEREDGTRPQTTEIFQRNQQYDTFRPILRPDNLQEQNDRANLTGLSRPELAAFRPSLRPETVKAEAEEDVTATAQAVGTSERPSVRPGNIAAIVAAVEASRAASAQEQQQQPAQTQQVAAVAPRTVAPSVPSNTSVSQAATETNAINLRRMNLIGVYGNPSNRQALVRLSNGRYVRVGVGDRIDGGRVSAIGESQLRYVKGGRNLTLEIPG
jgi:hypothetical protein